jgi:hypothetical protein
MRRTSWLAIAFILGFAVSARGGDATESKTSELIALESQDSQVMEHLDYLTNKIGPRLTGSHNLDKAIEWTAGQFTRFGLQNVHTECWGHYPIYFDRGPMSGKLLSDDGELPLVFGSMAWTAGTNGPVRGPAFYYPKNMDELASIKDKLKGAWLVTKGTGGGRGQGRGGASRADRDALRKACDEAGIAGTVRSVGGDLIITDGSPSGITMQKLPTRVSVGVTAKEFKEICKAIDSGGRADLEFDVQNHFSAGPTDNKLVVAEIPGTEKPDEVVIVGGHLDSWDGATGATDNGTGVATTLEAARLLVKVGARPKRTLRFILWSGEEQGLLSSAWYVKKHKDELAKVSCILIHDGGTNYVSGIAATKAMMPLMEPALAGLNWDEKMKFKVHQVRHLPFGVGSDHDSFLAAGVPGFFWDQMGKQNYDHEHHTQYDTYDAAIPEYQKHSSVVIAQGALAIANLDQLLPRDDMLAPRGETARKMLGVQCDPDLVIQAVVDGSLAEGAGLMEGDRLLSLGGTNISSVEELRAAVQEAHGETVVKFVREGKEREVKVVFADEAKKKRWL